MRITDIDAKELTRMAESIASKGQFVSIETTGPDIVGPLMKWLNEEIERHKAAENAESTSWGRGFHNGSMTQCLLMRTFIRSLGGADDGGRVPQT